MKKVRIFISSPGDVTPERKEAGKVVRRLQKRYTGRLDLVPVLWEEFPLQADMPFQEGINALLSASGGVDIAVFILWARLGTPVGATVLREDGSRYQSGTECELDLMLKAREASGAERPTILIYLRRDDEALLEKKKKIVSSAELREFEEQEEKLRRFVFEYIKDAETGENYRAYTRFQNPITFSQRLYTHLRAVLDESRTLTGDWDVVERGPPYQGLEVFDEEHADIFYGRDEESCRVLDQLQRKALTGCAFVLIVGASGSGKSSLARAGVMANIQPYGGIAEWRHAVMTPCEHASGDPITALVEAILRAVPEMQQGRNNVEKFIEGMRSDPALTVKLTLEEALAEAVQGPGSGSIQLILLVDQLEEIYTHTQLSKGARMSLIVALDALARSGVVHVLATVRADFYGRCQELPLLMEMKSGDGQFDLLPSQPGAIHAMITKPASRAGFSFEENPVTGKSLDTVVLNESISQPEALPHVQFLLRNLFEACQDRADRVFTFEAYEKLGGVAGAIANKAEQVYLHGNGITDLQRDAFPAVVRRLLTLRGGHHSEVPVRTRVRYDELSEIENAKPLIDAFVDARLLIAGRDEQGRAMISISHETLFRSWKRLAEWVADNVSNLRVRARLQEAISTWRDNGWHNEYLLPGGKPIDDFAELAATVGLTGEEAEFVFRSSMYAGQDLQRCSQLVEKISPGMREKIVGAALRDSSDKIRLSAAYLAGLTGGRGFVDLLLRMAFEDPSEMVRKECAIALAEIDDGRAFDAIVERYSDRQRRRRAIYVLSRLRILLDGPLAATDRTVECSEFSERYAKLGRFVRGRIRLNSWITRLKEGFSVIPVVVVPAILMAGFCSAAYKWIPGAFNLAICQGTGSAGMGIFHALTAAVIWIGTIFLSLTLYRVVFGREREYCGIFRPLGAVVAGLLAGLFSSVAITLVIASVFESGSLVRAGWITETHPRFSTPFLEDLFVHTRFGWAYLCSGTMLGVGLALTTNALRASGKWEDFLLHQSRISGFGDAFAVLRGTSLMAFRFCIPLLAALAVGGVAEYIVCEPPLAGASKWATWDDPQLFLALSILADSGAQFLGGVFGLAGLGLGIVIVRHGVEIEPRSS